MNVPPLEDSGCLAAKGRVDLAEIMELVPVHVDAKDKQRLDENERYTCSKRKGCRHTLASSVSVGGKVALIGDCHLLGLRCCTDLSLVLPSGSEQEAVRRLLSVPTAEVSFCDETSNPAATT